MGTWSSPPQRGEAPDAGRELGTSWETNGKADLGLVSHSPRLTPPLVPPRRRTSPGPRKRAAVQLPEVRRVRRREQR